MNQRLIGAVVLELSAALVGRAWGKVFQFARASLAVDFRPGGGAYLLLSTEPNRPRIHLIKRTVRELERDSIPPAPFALVLRKRLGGATLLSIKQDEGERVVRFHFEAEDATGRALDAALVAQLTGRTANLFLLDESGRVVDSLRPARGEGQETGELYRPPTRKPTHEVAHGPTDTSSAGGYESGADDRDGIAASPARPTERPKKVSAEPSIERGGFASLSEALDARYLAEDRARAFEQRVKTAAAKLKQEVSKLSKLRVNLSRDLEAHGDADEHKRTGDLLLANLATAKREGGKVRLTDYYADDAPTVEVEVDENRSLQEEAAARFARYGKARRAAGEITRRLAEIEKELAALYARRSELERIAEESDEDALAQLTGAETGDERAAKRRGAAKGRKGAKRRKTEAGASLSGVRRYRSSDGYEILVGRGSRDNDHLTFRLARSYDLWLHAADYPGSHVVVRARGRDEEIPHRTVIEAAQLAAHFSRAGRDAKVAVNYAQRKLVTKPKGAAPGLVYLTGFRTLLVEPREACERI